MGPEFGQSSDVGEFTALLTIIKLPCLSHMTQTIELRADTQPHLNQIIIRGSTPTKRLLGI